MADERRLRAVLAGCGSMSAAWLNSASVVPDIEIVGLVDLNMDAARGRAAEFVPHARVGTDLLTMLDEVAPDLVFDCTIPEAHYDVTLTALKHGCHVLGEKPLSVSMDHARRMCDAAQEAGKLYAVIQNRRFDLRIRRLRAFLESGELGAITTVNSDFFIGAHFGGFRDRMQHPLVLDMAIHTFDMARFICGADPLSVYCKEWNPSASWYDGAASAVAVFEMTGGIIYTYRGSWCSEGFHTAWDAEWRVIGQDGTARWDGYEAMDAQVIANRTGFRYTTRDVELPPAPVGSKEGGHRGQIEEMVHCIRHGGTPETICTDNIKSLAMVFSAIESAQQRREVPVSW